MSKTMNEMRVYRMNSKGSEVQVYTCGNPANQPVILLHGFMQDGRTWEVVAQTLGERYFLLMPDFPGHGATITPYEAKEFDLVAHETLVDVLVDALSQGYFSAVSREKPILVGYSMGGRVAAQYAASHAKKLKAVVLESAGLGLSDEADRAARKAKNEELSARLTEEPFEDFVAFWEALPLFASQKHIPREVQEMQRQVRLENEPIALAYSLRYAGQQEMTDLTEQLVNTRLDLLYLAGELDVTYTKVAQRLQTRAKQSALVQTQIVEGVGHNIHLANPELYCRIVQEFLTTLH